MTRIWRNSGTIYHIAHLSNERRTRGGRRTRVRKASSGREGGNKMETKKGGATKAPRTAYERTRWLTFIPGVAYCTRRMIDRATGGPSADRSDIFRNIFETPFSGSLRYILHAPVAELIFGGAIVRARANEIISLPI